MSSSFVYPAVQQALERTRQSATFIRSCVGEPLKRSVRQPAIQMMNHDPRCEGEGNVDQELLDAVAAKDGWYVIKVLDTHETPAWAYSVGLFKTFRHPEIIVFGLDLDLMHYMINV